MTTGMIAMNSREWTFMFVCRTRGNGHAPLASWPAAGFLGHPEILPFASSPTSTCFVFSELHFLHAEENYSSI
jgi:hypothetical protein